MRGKKIDRVTVLRNLQKIEEEDYDGFVLLIRAARNRHATFDPDLPVWDLAQRLGIIAHNRSGVPEFDESMRDFIRESDRLKKHVDTPHLKDVRDTVPVSAVSSGGRDTA